MMERRVFGYGHDPRAGRDYTGVRLGWMVEIVRIFSRSIAFVFLLGI
jgi:hypothetical protein